MLKKVVLCMLAGAVLMGSCLAAPEVPAPSCLLMDRATGTVLYEKNADEPLAPASVTKVMTLRLIRTPAPRLLRRQRAAVRSIWRRGSR